MKADVPLDLNRIFVEKGHIIDEAIRKAARDAILQHRREGLPVALYREGKVVWIDANDVDIE